MTSRRASHIPLAVQSTVTFILISHLPFTLPMAGTKRRGQGELLRHFHRRFERPADVILASGTFHLY